MNRDEFMRELDNMLQDIPFEERKEALQYYNDYFDDAGIEKESMVITELESPQKVAATIKGGMDVDDNVEYTESGYKDARYDDLQVPAKKSQGMSNQKIFKIIVAGIILILAIPVVFPIIGSLLGIIFSIIMVPIGILIGICVGGIALAIASIVLLVFGFVRLLTGPLSGVFLIGLALIVGVIAALMIAVTFFIVTTVIPPVFRWAVELVKTVIEKGKEKLQ